MFDSRVIELSFASVRGSSSYLELLGDSLGACSSSCFDWAAESKGRDSPLVYSFAFLRSYSTSLSFAWISLDCSSSIDCVACLCLRLVSSAELSYLTFAFSCSLAETSWATLMSFPSIRCFWGEVRLWPNS